ncbi:MAG: ATP-binding protein [Acidimicrobiales bacterium]
MDEAQPGDVVELELPARPEVVSVARMVIGALVAGDPLFDDERAADMRLAVSEACTNAIQAHLAHPAAADDHLVVMRCTLAAGHIEVEVTDHGGGFDPAELRPHPDVTDPARLEHERGLGIPLMRMLADDLRFDAVEGGTRTTMRFEPRSRPAAEGGEGDPRPRGLG